MSHSVNVIRKAWPKNNHKRLFLIILWKCASKLKLKPDFKFLFFFFSNSSSFVFTLINETFFRSKQKIFSSFPSYPSLLSSPILRLLYLTCRWQDPKEGCCPLIRILSFERPDETWNKIGEKKSRLDSSFFKLDHRSFDTKKGILWKLIQPYEAWKKISYGFVFLSLTVFEKKQLFLVLLTA